MALRQSALAPHGHMQTMCTQRTPVVTQLLTLLGISHQQMWPVASSTLPLMDAAAAIGSGTTWARADHVHPVDTSRYAASNPSGYLDAATGDARYVNVGGDTMTGQLTVNATLNLTATGTSWSQIIMSRAAGQGNQILGYTGVSVRWALQLGDSSAETGGNVGSDFGIYRYNDSGGL